MISSSHAKYLSDMYKDSVHHETRDSIVEDVLDNINDGIIEEAMRGNTSYQYVLRDLRVDNEVEDRVIEELIISGYSVNYVNNSTEYPFLSTNNLARLDYLEIKW